MYFRQTPPTAPREMRVEITTPPTAAPLDFALSPDGRYIVSVASGDGSPRLWLRALYRTDSQPLGGTEGATMPFWSADSRSIGFFAASKLKRIDIGGAFDLYRQLPHTKPLQREQVALGHNADYVLLPLNLLHDGNMSDGLLDHHQRCISRSCAGIERPHIAAHNFFDRSR
jgi:hypothetical protein